ncbi:unnamed protein product [marine sediment metagenome]|uniref:Uncharacterized protein n=1 Tax=marine sediment metagenome TaxID=412755 RepID=X1FWB2_9ZZZZ
MPLKIEDYRELPTEEVTHGCCTDGLNIFYSTWDSPAKIFKVNPVTLDVDTLLLSTGWNWGNDICYCNGYLWTCLFYTNDFKIARIDSNLSNWVKAIDKSGYKCQPMSLAVDSINNIVYCGTVANVIAIDVSNPDSVSYEIMAGCPTRYNHAIAFMSGGLYGWGFKSFSWDNPQNPALWRYKGGSYQNVDLEVSLTDDMCVYDGHVYGISEAWWEQSQAPQICKVDSALNVTYLPLDENKIGQNMDGLTSYKGKIYITCRSAIYPFVEVDSALSKPIYIPKTPDFDIVYPDEALVFGDYLYVQNMEAPWGGINRVYKMSYEMSYGKTVTFKSMPVGATVTVVD